MTVCISSSEVSMSYIETDSPNHLYPNVVWYGHQCWHTSAVYTVESITQTDITCMNSMPLLFKEHKTHRCETADLILT